MLSIIIPWYNRNELKQALPSLIASAEDVASDITIVNLGGDAELLRQQIPKEHSKIRIVHTQAAEHFNKPTAQNIGACNTNSPYLFFCDCDIILPPNELANFFYLVASSANSFGTIAQAKETQLNARSAGNLSVFGYQLRLKIKDGTEIKIIDNEEDAADGTRQAPGLLLVKRSDFEKVGGYNAGLDGWGWEDQDMICRLGLAGKLNRVTHGKVLHVSHDDNSRMLGYKQYIDRWQSRDHMFRTALRNYDQGNFMGTYQKDIKKHSVTVEYI